MSSLCADSYSHACTFSLAYIFTYAYLYACVLRLYIVRAYWNELSTCSSSLEVNCLPFVVATREGSALLDSVCVRLVREK